MLCRSHTKGSSRNLSLFGCRQTSENWNLLPCVSGQECRRCEVQLFRVPGIPNVENAAPEGLNPKIPEAPDPKNKRGFGGGGGGCISQCGCSSFRPRYGTFRKVGGSFFWDPYKKSSYHLGYYIKVPSFRTPPIYVSRTQLLFRCDPTFDCEFNDWSHWSLLVAKKSPESPIPLS